MKFFRIILVFSLLAFACKQPAKQKPVTVNNIEVQNIDLYPQYRTCPDYFEKDKQLECLMLKINNFITYHINKKYQKDFKELKDTLWVKFEIDTLGHIHYINITHINEIGKDSMYNDIFKKIAYKIPKMKPAIYQGNPVNFEFKVPIVNSNQ